MVVIDNCKQKALGELLTNFSSLLLVPCFGKNFSLVEVIGDVKEEITILCTPRVFHLGSFPMHVADIGRCSLKIIVGFS